jgi:hypothetical protein
MAICRDHFPVVSGLVGQIARRVTVGRGRSAANHYRRRAARPPIHIVGYGIAHIWIATRPTQRRRHPHIRRIVRRAGGARCVRWIIRDFARVVLRRPVSRHTRIGAVGRGESVACLLGCHRPAPPCVDGRAVRPTAVRHRAARQPVHHYPGDTCSTARRHRPRNGIGRDGTSLDDQLRLVLGGFLGVDDQAVGGGRAQAQAEGAVAGDGRRDVILDPGVVGDGAAGRAEGGAAEGGGIVPRQVALGPGGVAHGVDRACTVAAVVGVQAQGGATGRSGQPADGELEVAVVERAGDAPQPQVGQGPVVPGG